MNALRQHTRPWGDCGWGLLWLVFASPELWERSPSPALPGGQSEEIPRHRECFKVPLGTGSPDTAAARSRAGQAAGLPQPRCRAGGWEGSAPRSSPRTELGRAAGGLSLRPHPGCGALQFPGEGGTEEGRAAARPQHLPSGQGGRADTGDPLCPRLGDGENQVPGPKRLDGEEPPSLPRPPRRGSRSGACARRGCREGAAFEAAALDTHVGPEGQVWE